LEKTRIDLKSSTMQDPISPRLGFPLSVIFLCSSSYPCFLLDADVTVSVNKHTPSWGNSSLQHPHQKGKRWSLPSSGKRKVLDNDSDCPSVDHRLKLKKHLRARNQWTPVILATQETEIRRIMVWSQSRQRVHETQPEKNPSQKKWLVE
jgi:hypothetical protein